MLPFDSFVLYGFSWTCSLVESERGGKNLPFFYFAPNHTKEMTRSVKFTKIYFQNFGFFEKCKPGDFALKRSCLLVCEKGYQLSNPKYNRIKCQNNVKKPVWKPFKTVCVEKGMFILNWYRITSKSYELWVRSVPGDLSAKQNPSAVIFWVHTI